jgi:hypothetical protein
VEFGKFVGRGKIMHQNKLIIIINIIIPTSARNNGRPKQIHQAKGRTCWYGNARPNDLVEVLTVPTIFGPNPADNDEIDLQQMDLEDVKCLRRQGEHTLYDR